MSDIMFTNILGEVFKRGEDQTVVYTIIEQNSTFHILSNILDNMLNYSRNTGLEIFKHPNSIVEYHKKFECEQMTFKDTYSRDKMIGGITLRKGNGIDVPENVMWIDELDSELSYMYRNCKITSATLPSEIRKNHFNQKDLQ
ncbi:MAG: hypothetical protein KDD32_09855 [Bacteroidetes bacterium]|nr:hypothetical protein [Bacteroidota bacterium]